MLRAASSHTSTSSISGDAPAATAAAAIGGGALPEARQAAEGAVGGRSDRYETFSSRKYSDEFTGAAATELLLSPCSELHDAKAAAQA